MQTATIEPIDDQMVIREVEPGADGLSLLWSDQHRSFFHDIWLRDCCYCEICGDSYSSKRFLLPSDIPIEIKAATASITADGDLSITWQNDGHVSHYDRHWLRAHCYDDESRAARFHKPLRWDTNIARTLPKVSFAAVQSDDRQKLEMYRKLRDYGFVVVTDGPAENGGIKAVANLIGDMGDSAYSKIFDLSPASTVKTMGNTFKTVPPHTDEAFRYAPPGIIVLGCVRPASTGGESILVDGFYIAECLRQENQAMFDLLCQYQQSFNRIHPGTLDQRGRQRMISLNDRGEVIGIRLHTRSAGPMDLPTELVKPYYAAHRRLCELMMNPENQLKFKLKSGDSVLFDNYRVLHSRTEFEDPQRFLQLCNVDRETYHERLRLLAASLDFPDEANMVLPAGLC